MEHAETTMLPAASLAGLMKNYADYNLWANATLATWLRTKPADLLEKELPSSYPGIKATIVHIWQTQRYWLSVISGQEQELYDPFDGTAAEAICALVEQSDAFADHIKLLTEENIADEQEVISPWFRCNFQNLEYVMHAMNHSTYHRGQIITMCRQLGFTDAPMTDYLFYNIHGR
ncbi:MAG TPA: DinB family protein [Mucilaginibacter sp.]|nr:DinB family protein [Mucilaginibacter sp.]